MEKSWSQWFRENFDKLLLAVLFEGAVMLVIHMTHDGRDADQILWARELAGTFAGALLGLITGHALASRATATIPGGTATTKTEG